MPSRPRELVEHGCIFVGGGKPGAAWRFEREGRRAIMVTVRGRFSANNHGLMRTLADLEMGVAALAPSVCREAIAAGRLVPVMPDWLVPRLGVNAVTTSHLHTAAVRAFVDFVADRFS